MSFCSSTTGKKGKEIKKRKITKKSINTCYSQICSYLGSEVPAGKVRIKILGCLYAFIDFLACTSFLNYILYLFHFVSSYFIPEWTLHLLWFYCPGFVLSNVYFLFLYMPYFVCSKVKIFSGGSRMQPCFISHEFHSRFPTLHCPLLLLEHLKIKLEIKYVWGTTIIKVYIQ